MKNITPKKVHIIGSVGSGKTTLATVLSERLDVPYYELDNVVWKRTIEGDIRNSEEVRDRQFNNIISSDKWIVEGVHHRWVSKGFQQAEIIIYLDTNTWKRKYRILKRFILQKLGLEKANYKPTFKMFKQMFKWNDQFEKEGKPEILLMLTEYKDKVIILNDNRDIENLINGLTKRSQHR